MQFELDFLDRVHPDRLHFVRSLNMEQIKAMSGLSASLSMMQGRGLREIQTAQLLSSKMAKGIDAYLKCNMTPFNFQGLPAFQVEDCHCSAALIDLAEATSDEEDVAIILPSFINSGAIFSAGGEHSFAAFLSQNKIHPFVLNWNISAQMHHSYTLSDYIHRVLWPLLSAFLHGRARKVHFIGYCFGGVILALFLSLYRHEMDQNITTSYMATPWRGSPDLIADKLPFQGDIKAETLHSYFTSLKPTQIIEKYARLSDLVEAYLTSKKSGELQNAHQCRDQIRKFVAVEDWLLGGEDIPGALFQSFFSDRGEDSFSNWVDPKKGEGFRPGHFKDVPSLHILACEDHLVPNESSLSLFNVMEDQRKETGYFDGGHIGLMASGRAKSRIWHHIVKFMLES